jgi:hypothetical protein
MNPNDELAGAAARRAARLAALNLPRRITNSVVDLKAARVVSVRNARVTAALRPLYGLGLAGSELWHAAALALRAGPAAPIICRRVLERR